MPNLRANPQASLTLRQSIIDCLKGRELTAKQIHQHMPKHVTYSAMSYHMGVMADEGFIEHTKKRGLNFLYKVLKTQYVATPIIMPDKTKPAPIEKSSSSTIVSSNDYHTKGSSPKRSNWIGSSMGGF